MVVYLTESLLSELIVSIDPCRDFFGEIFFYNKIDVIYHKFVG